MDKIERDFLVVGHPRTGTGYMSKLFGAAGLNVGHEWIGYHGISCWMFATPDGNYARGPRGDIKNRSRKHFSFKYIIHNVKHPFTCMSSIVNIENNAKDSYNFRKKYVAIKDSAPRLERAVLSFLGWHEMIEKTVKVDCVIQIENAEEQLREFLESKNIPCNYRTNLPPKDYNTRRNSSKYNYEPILQSEWNALPQKLKDKLNAFCEKYGYEKIKFI